MMRAPAEYSLTGIVAVICGSNAVRPGLVRDRSVSDRLETAWPREVR